MWQSDSEETECNISATQQQAPEINPENYVRGKHVNQESAQKVNNKQFVLNVVGFDDVNVDQSPSGSAEKRKSIFICELCGKHLDSKPRLCGHINKHVSNPYKCQTCCKTFYSIYVFNKHMTVEHKDFWECPECGKWFGIKTSWYNHQKIHRDIVYECLQPSCSYTVRSESRFKEHYKYAHRDRKTVKCPDCSQWFQTPLDRNNHKKSKHWYR